MKMAMAPNLILMCICPVAFTLDNLALYKESQMSSRRSISGPDVVVDGNTEQSASGGFCALTDLHGVEAWWSVDLNGTYSISQLIVVLPNTNTFRFRYYSVHVTDDLDNWKSSAACAMDHESILGPPSSVVQLNCDSKGRYLTIWLNRPIKCDADELFVNYCDILELCEVLVLGCQPGFYSQHCNKTCPVNCRDDICAIDNGKCYSCKDGYLGDYCDRACEAGKFGRECLNTCNGFCRNGLTCSNVNGFCPQFCEDGYEGNFCNKTCSNGTFGFKCKETCGHCVNDESCHHITGICENGCDIGRKGAYCNIGCQPGEYGPACMYNCSANCVNDDACDAKTGVCPNGCASGWLGPFCNLSCIAGSFGFGCSETCGNCLNNGTCEYINGRCPSGCASGWTGDNCKIGLIYVSLVYIVPGATIVILMVIVAFVVYLLRRNVRGRRAKNNDDKTVKYDTAKYDDVNWERGIQSTYDKLQTKNQECHIYDSLSDSRASYENTRYE